MTSSGASFAKIDRSERTAVVGEILLFVRTHLSARISTSESRMYAELSLVYYRIVALPSPLSSVCPGPQVIFSFDLPSPPVSKTRVVLFFFSSLSTEDHSTRRARFLYKKPDATSAKTFWVPWVPKFRNKSHAGDSIRTYPSISFSRE